MLITFSGMDGAGKSTQIARARTYFAAHGRRSVYIWSRGGYTPLFSGAKTLLRRLAGRSLPPSGHTPQRTAYLQKNGVRTLWLSLALCDLLWLYGVVVRTWQMMGRIVICDRYLWDTLIDFRLSFPGVVAEDWWMWKLLERLTPTPDAAFLLMISPTESMIRSQNPDKYEPFPDPLPIREQRYAQYQQLTVGNDHLDVVDATQSIDAVWSQIQRRADQLMAG